MFKCHARFCGTLFFIIILLLSYSLADAADKEQVFELNLNQAVELALKQNADFYLAALDLKHAKAAFNRAVLINDIEMIETAEETLEKQQQNFDNSKRDLITSI
ncbi:MAG: hypothetical protein GX994_02895, partial [Firmicutes bacterium]|nr:hypothetical protein [Bacillota bacterium]